MAFEYDGLRPQVPEVYHLYLDVFSTQNAITLPPCCLYDHSTVLEDGTTPPFGPIYSLSGVKKLVICNFVDEN